MTNPFYTRVFNPLPGQRVDEQTLKDEYQRVEQGFDGVQTDIASVVGSIAGKADKAGGNTWTGTQNFTGAVVQVATPTQASHAVSKQYADALAMSAAIPVAPGDASKLLTNDGTTPGWGPIFPALTPPDVGKILGVTGVNTVGFVSSRGGGAATPSGNITLTAASAGVQRITPTGPGQWVKLPNATTMTAGTGVYTLSSLGSWDMEIQDSTGAALGYLLPGATAAVSLSSIATAAGIWELQGASTFGIVPAEINFPLSLGTGGTGSLYGAVSIDATRELLLFSGDTRLYGVVWDNVNSAFGTPVLIRSADVRSRVRAINSAANQVLVVSSDAATALEAVALTITGTAIAVNTAASASLVGNMSSIDDLISVAGQGFVVGYRRATSTAGMRALTVTGTTVAIGAESLTAGDGTSPPMLYDIGSSKVIVMDWANPSITVGLRTVSGTTLTAGTAATLASGSTSYSTRMLASGRVAVVFRSSSGGSLLTGAIISVSGTVVTASQVTLGSFGVTPQVVHVVGSQVIVGSSATVTAYINVLTDNAGTAVAGTEFTRDQLGNTISIVAADATSVTMIGYNVTGAASGLLLRVGVSGNNPTVLASRFVNAAPFTNGGLSQPSSPVYFKDTLPAGVLKGASTSVAGFTGNQRDLLWVSTGGMPQLVPTQPMLIPGGGNGRVRSMSNNWEWTGFLTLTGLTVAVQKLKVA